LAHGDPASAKAYCQQALEINRLIGHRRGEALCLEILEKASAALKRPAETKNSLKTG
jgi:hypothetical protein